jgi:hypothetical protein
MLTNEPKKNITRKEHTTLRFKIFVFLPEHEHDDEHEDDLSASKAVLGKILAGKQNFDR